MASAKSDLQRAGTMQVTAEEGKQYLEKNLTEWKKPYLAEHFDDDDDAGTSDKPALSKHTTMKTTAKEADAILGDDKPDSDAQTRGQNKKLEEIKNEKPPAKKAKLAKAGTMAVTAKEGKALLKGQKIGDTRNETKAKKGQPKKADSISKTMAEAKAVYGDLDLTEGRRLRKRPEPPKPAMKKAGTMQRTAKEGKAFLKRGRPKKNAPKVEKPVEEVDESKEESSEEATSD